MDIKFCPICRQELNLDHAVKEGEFNCPSCKSHVMYTIEKAHICMNIHTPEDINKMKWNYLD